MKKAILLAAMACVAMIALPAVAWAGVWHVDRANLAFDGTGGTFLVTSSAPGSSVHCTSKKVTGEYETTTTGWIEITYEKCITPPFGQKCVGATPKLTFHNVLLSANEPAILITPNDETGVFASSSCFGTVIGSGLIGEIQRGCGEKASSATITFTSVGAGVPEHTQVTGQGTVYGLEYSFFSVFVKTSEDSAITIEFAEGEPQTFNCTEA